MMPARAAMTAVLSQRSVSVLIDPYPRRPFVSLMFVRQARIIGNEEAGRWEPLESAWTVASI
jgi:hypothetical protein